MAERIGREAKLRQYAPRVMAMDAFDVRLLPEEPLVVFVTSTTGQVASTLSSIVRIMSLHIL